MLYVPIIWSFDISANYHSTCEFIIAIVGTAAPDSGAAGYVLVVFVCIYIAFFASTWGPAAVRTAQAHFLLLPLSWESELSRSVSLTNPDEYLLTPRSTVGYYWRDLLLAHSCQRCRYVYCLQLWVNKFLYLCLSHSTPEMNQALTIFLRALELCYRVYHACK